ncbi:hypothetical protein GBA52_019878 [Prunus armeniaca]|nr:hypothetical protein GBA52_019878 [Prunus armeniaca]
MKSCKLGLRLQQVRKERSRASDMGESGGDLGDEDHGGKEDEKPLQGLEISVKSRLKEVGDEGENRNNIKERA